MQKEVKLSELSIIELKALKSDIYEEQQRSAQNLVIINQELASRTQKAQNKPNMDETTNDVVVEEVVETTEEATETAE
jgi:hypothetical protein